MTLFKRKPKPSPKKIADKIIKDATTASRLWGMGGATNQGILEDIKLLNAHDRVLFVAKMCDEMKPHIRKDFITTIYDYLSMGYNPFK